MSDIAKVQQEAFVDGAVWAFDQLYSGWGGPIGTSGVRAAAERRYSHVDIELAPSGRWYRIVGEGEPRGFDTEAEARKGDAIESHVGIKAGDEAAVARLLNRMAERRGAA